MQHPLCRLLPLTIYIISLVTVSSSFKVDLKVPEVIIIPSNEGHWFNCSARSLSKDETVQSISWLKDDNIFYTYSNLQDKVQVKLLPARGVTGIDDTSTSGFVKLTNVNVNSSGCYKCEVKLTDGRAKVVGERSTAIYSPREEGGVPSIQLFPSVHLSGGLEGTPLIVRTIGETIGIKCRTRPSNPGGRVEIKVNNVRRDDLQWRSLDVSIDTISLPIDKLPYSNILYSTTFTGTFEITREMVTNGFMLISCTSILTSTHGFIEQTDSPAIRVRVVKPIQRVYENSLLERQKYFFLTVIALTASAFAVHQICSLVSRVARRSSQDDTVQRSISRHEC